MSAEPATGFTIDATAFIAALRQLGAIGEKHPDKVQEFGLRVSMGEEMSFIHSRRSGLTIEPSQFLRGFIAAFDIPASDDEPEAGA